MLAKQFKQFFVFTIISILSFSDDFCFAQVEDEIVALKSGKWSDPDTWGGNIPGDGSIVSIPSGVEVLFDTISSRIKKINLAGVFRFEKEKNTLLYVETFMSQPLSKFEIGTSSEPVPNHITSQIVIIDNGSIDIEDDYDQISKGLILRGAVEIYGAKKTSWLPLGNFPKIGDSSVSLSEMPEGWEVGDEIVITGTEPDNPESDEKRRISRLDSTIVILDEPLTRDHISPRNDLKVHVANLSRNVVFRSENPVIERRGHVMFMKNLDVDLNNARFYQMGRTNKRIQVDDWYYENLIAEDGERGPRTNIRGRYSVHFHRGGVDPNKSSPAHVEGCVVEDDPGWAYVNHSSNVDFIDNVSYNVVGGAYQTESGDEIGSFIHNIAIRTVNPDYPILNWRTSPVDIRENTQDFAFQGDAYWIHGGGVALEDNVASGSSGHGFIFWTEGQREVDTEFWLMNHFLTSNIPNGDLITKTDEVDSWWVPIKSFKNNTTYSSVDGLAAYYIHATLFEDIHLLSDEYLETVHSTLEGLNIWNVQRFGIELQNCERFTFKNVNIINDNYTNAIGIDIKNQTAGRNIWDNVNVKGFEIGMIVPMQGEVTIRNGEWGNLWDFQIIPPQSDSRPQKNNRDLFFDNLKFIEAPEFPSSERINFKLEGKATLEGRLNYIADSEWAHKYFLIPDRITIKSEQYDGLKRIYYDEQAPDFVPIRNSNIDEAEGTYKTDILSKSNRWMWDNLGLSFAGALLPNDAEQVEGIDGGLLSDVDFPTMNIPSCTFVDEPPLPVNFGDDFDFYECWDDSPKMAGMIGRYDHELEVYYVDSSDFSYEIESAIIASNDEEILRPILVYPNPVDGEIRVKGARGKNMDVDILSLSGQLVLTRNIVAGEKVDVETLKSGIYLIRIKTANEFPQLFKILKR